MLPRWTPQCSISLSDVPPAKDCMNHTHTTGDQVLPASGGPSEPPASPRKAGSHPFSLRQTSEGPEALKGKEARYRQGVRRSHCPLGLKVPRTEGRHGRGPVLGDALSEGAEEQGHGIGLTPCFPVTGHQSRPRPPRPLTGGVSSSTAPSRSPPALLTASIATDAGWVRSL